MAAAFILHLKQQNLFSPKVPLLANFPGHGWPPLRTRETPHNCHIEGKRLMQEQAHGRVVSCSSLDTGVCQDPGTGARFYIPGDASPCLIIWQELLPEVYAFTRFNKIFNNFPNVIKKNRTGLVSWDFTISNWGKLYLWASCPLAAYLRCVPVHFPLRHLLLSPTGNVILV